MPADAFPFPDIAGIQKNPPSNVLPGSVWNKNTSKSSMA